MLRALLVLGKYPALVAATAYVLNHYAGWATPTWAVLTGALATIPIAICLTIGLRCWNVSRATKRYGATLAPPWEGRWFANFDVLRDVLNSFRHGYPGEYARVVAGRRGGELGLQAMFCGRSSTSWDPRTARMSFGSLVS